MRLRAWTRAAALAALAAGVAAADAAGAQESERARGEASAGARRARAARGRRPTSDRVFVHDGRIMQRFGWGPDGSTAYAETLNAIHEAVGDRATIYAVIVPTAQEFYCPEPPPPGRLPEQPNILATYALLDPAIRRVDAHSELLAHVDENLYFRSDVHWTGLAGYYTYRAFCAAAGLEPVPLEQMERRVVNPAWRGSLARYGGDAELEPDVVEVFMPPAEVELRLPRDDGSGAGRVVPLFSLGARGYAVFLGGDHPILRGRTSTESGRRVVLVKNSYGNAFAVHLVSHYEEVVFVDYRTFQGSLLDVLAESELPTDLVFMNGSLTSNSPTQCRMIRELLHGRT